MTVLKLRSCCEPWRFARVPVLAVGIVSLALGLSVLVLTVFGSCCPASAAEPDPLQDGFQHPPDEAKPRVYWAVEGGNLTREGITADFEAMHRIGLGGFLYMEVNDQPMHPGPVAFMSPEWLDLMTFAAQEANRLDLSMTTLNGAGWDGGGGKWVTPERSMQKLVSSSIKVTGPQQFSGIIPQPPMQANFYRDIAVLAYPTLAQASLQADASEKSLDTRKYFTSQKGTSSRIPSHAVYPESVPDQVIPVDGVIDISARMDARSNLVWNVPAGDWTVVRFGHTSNGKLTHPAPPSGIGLYCDRLNRSALEAHFNAFYDPLIKKIGPLVGKSFIGVHNDSWEVGPQNWTEKFREEFKQQRGYDLLPYLPVTTGQVVGSPEISDRFLWDFRQTILELCLENFAQPLADLAHQHQMVLSIEPYDGTPIDDMSYGARADIPMAEIWTTPFDAWFSANEASSIGHTYGRRIVQAESFTTGGGKDVWRYHPAFLKTLGDAIFTQGINRMVIHRYAMQPRLDEFPGTTMGAHGFDFERTQTWWEMARGWVSYLSRCQFLLQQGHFVADVCFLEPEASPQVFQAPPSGENGRPPTRPGYNFDGLTPEALLTRMSVRDGRLVLPDGMSYRLLVLPNVPTMTPKLLAKVKELVAAGATVMGQAPLKSPSLADYPKGDAQVKQMADELWGTAPFTHDGEARAFGKGTIISGPAHPWNEVALTGPKDPPLYPDFTTLGQVFNSLNVPPDFQADQPLRYIHRRADDADIYFLANGSNAQLSTTASFRVTGKAPEFWDPMTGLIRPARQYTQHDGLITVPLEFDPAGSLFVVFRHVVPDTAKDAGPNFAQWDAVQTLDQPWNVSFDPKWGGPASIDFPTLVDWTQRTEPGIKYYSGTATYKTTFTVASLDPNTDYALDLGTVAIMAEVKLNGQDLGIAWKSPFRLDTAGALKAGANQLEIQVVNQWPNRIIGDQALPPNQRLTHETYNTWKKNSPLLSSGLLGPVKLEKSSRP